MTRLLRRCLITATRLPVAAAWDAISLGNLGEGLSTTRVLYEHRRMVKLDALVDEAEALLGLYRKGSP